MKSFNIVIFNINIAQLVEHLHGMQGVSGSSPLGSINTLKNKYFIKEPIAFLPFLYFKYDSLYFFLRMKYHYL